MSKTELAFLDGQLYFNQSEQFEVFSLALIGWKKADNTKRPPFQACKPGIFLAYRVAISTENYF